MDQHSTVRSATVADEARLFDILVALHRNNNSGWGAPFDPALVMGRIEVGTRPNHLSRTNPADRRVGWIGVIGPEGGRLIGTVGLFIEPSAWFTTEAVALFEAWLFVRPGERSGGRHEKALFAFAEEKHRDMKAALAKTGYAFSFDLITGFLHQGPRFDAMIRLWRRMSGAKPVGVLFRKP